MRRIGTLSAVLALLLLKSVPVLAQSGQDDPTTPAPSDAVSTKSPGTSSLPADAPPDDGRWIASLAVKSPGIPAFSVSHAGDRWTARVETGMIGTEVAGSADLQRTIMRGGPF